MNEGPWQVSIHDDDLDSYPTVGYVLERVCGISRTRGLALADRAQRDGSVPAHTCGTQEEAERIAVEIQLLGLRARVEPRAGHDGDRAGPGADGDPGRSAGPDGPEDGSGPGDNGSAPGDDGSVPGDDGSAPDDDGGGPGPADGGGPER